jgi:uncharacterized membrane protein
MGNNITVDNKALNCGKAIKTISLISLITMALSCLSCFFIYSYIEGKKQDELAFVSWDILTWLCLALFLAPVILFVLYIFKYYSKPKATVIVPTIFGLLILNAFFNGFAFAYGYYYFGLDTILLLVILFGCVLAIFGFLKGLNKKVFVIIPLAASLFYEVLLLLAMLGQIEYYIEKAMYANIFAQILNHIGMITFYVALLLFGIKNNIPAIIKTYAKKKENDDPAEKLKVLKESFELGVITEEEYNAKRKEIISKL